MSLLLDRGNRGLLVGQTGSGKTQNAIFQLRHAKVWPVVILDTKIEDDFFGVPEEDDEIELIENAADFIRYAGIPRKEMADYVLVRPQADELRNTSLLDVYVQTLYEGFGPVFAYLDETYHFHDQGRPENGLIGLLTRGRSKGKTVLMATQRPAWISRFCLTEAQKFYIHLLADARDKKTLASVVPKYDAFPDPQKFHFHHYSIGDTPTPQLYRPVPYQKLDRRKVFRRKWV